MYSPIDRAYTELFSPSLDPEAPSCELLHPTCELFPAKRSAAWIFGIGAVLGLASFPLSAMGLGIFAWVSLVSAAVVMLFAGTQVSA
jgi:hypothetical protein